MTSRGTIAGALTLGAALLIGTPAAAPAQDPELEKQTLKQRVASLENELRELRQRLDLGNEMARGQRREILERLDRIEGALARLRADVRMDLRPRQAFSIDPERPFPRSAGTVRLVNEMPVWAVVRVNGVNYSVPPGDELPISQPAGPVVWAARRSGEFLWSTEKERDLTAGGSLTIRVYNR